MLEPHQASILLITSCVIMGMLLYFFVPWFFVCTKIGEIIVPTANACCTRAITAHRTFQRTVGITVIQRRLPWLLQEWGEAFSVLLPCLVLTWVNTVTLMVLCQLWASLCPLDHKVLQGSRVLLLPLYTPHEARGQVQKRFNQFCYKAGFEMQIWSNQLVY